MNLVNLNKNETITTLKLREIINSSRVSVGESSIQNTDFLKKVEDELDDLGGQFLSDPLPNGAPAMKYYELTIEQATLVGMRESKAVRRSVLSLLKSMSDPVPRTKIEWMQAAIDAEKAKEEALALANYAIATKAEIGSRREATAMNTASQAVKRVNQLEIELNTSKQYSTIKRMEMLYGIKFKWQLLKSAGKDLGIESKEVFDSNYGSVKAYHADVWMEAYALSIKQEAA